jgi:hypothetical protein
VLSCELLRHRRPLSPFNHRESEAGDHELAVVPFDAHQQPEVAMADDADLSHSDERAIRRTRTTRIPKMVTK